MDASAQWSPQRFDRVTHSLRFEVTLGMDEAVLRSATCSWRRRSLSRSRTVCDRSRRKPDRAVGALMGTIADAIAWSGSEAVLSMFVVSDSGALSDLALHLAPAPVAVRRYLLEDERSVLGGRTVWEYDFVFPGVPEDLDRILTCCLEGARAAGALVAWFGFEGSFDYALLLSSEVASQVYAVSDSTGVSIASDDTLSSDEWKARVVQAGIEARPRVGLP